MTRETDLQERLPQDSYKYPLVIAYGIDARHWISDKAKAYSSLKYGFPDNFDTLKVEYQDPEVVSPKVCKGCYLQQPLHTFGDTTKNGAKRAYKKKRIWLSSN